MTPLTTLRKIKDANEAAGQHFFEADTMRFFNSRLSEAVYPAPEQRRTYLVTSEQNRGFGGHYPRRYTVRAADWATGDVATVGEFQAYKTLAQAQNAARKLAEGSAR